MWQLRFNFLLYGFCSSWQWSILWWQQIASECLPGMRVPLSGAWCQSAWCAATVWMVSLPSRVNAPSRPASYSYKNCRSSKNLLLWGRQGGPAHFSHAGHKCCHWTLVLYHEAHQELPEEHHASRPPQSSDDLAHLSTGQFGFSFCSEWLCVT